MNKENGTINPSTNLPWQEGDIFWQGAGLMWGRDVDDSTTAEFATEEEALSAAEDEWLSWLTKKEKEGAEVYARKFKIWSVDEDGTVGAAATCD